MKIKLFCQFFLFLVLALSKVSAQGGGWPLVLGGSGGADISQVVFAGDKIVAGGSFLQTFPHLGGQESSAGGSDIFLLWFDSLGQQQQSLFIGNANNDYLRALLADSLGQLYVLGEFRGNLQLGTFSLQSNTQTHFVGKISPLGQWLWVEQLQAKGPNQVLDMVFDYGQQHLLLSGFFSDSLSMQGHQLFDDALANAFVLKINAVSGQALWLQKPPRAVEAKAWTLAALPNGHIWVAMEYRDSFFMPQDSFFFNPVYSDIALGRIDPNGQWQEVKSWYGVFNNRPIKLRLAPNAQELWLAGDFVGILNLDPPLQLITALRYYDIFWVKMSLDAQALAAGQSNTIANSYLQTLVFGQNELLLGGYFQDSISALSTEMLYTRGGFDFYWYRVNPQDATLENAVSLGGTGNDLLNSADFREGRLISGGNFQQNIYIEGQPLQAMGFSNGWLSLTSISRLLPTQNIEQDPFRVLEMSLFPNPARHSVQIRLSETCQDIVWQLYDAKARRVAQGRGVEIGLHDLAPGVYSVTVQTEKGMAVGKLVIE